MQMQNQNEEYNKNEVDVLLTLSDHDHQIKSLKHRMDAAERKQDGITQLTNSVNELAINMRYMLEEQKDQGMRLSALEKEPAENSKYIRRTLLSCVITAVVSAVVGAIIGLVLR